MQDFPPNNNFYMCIRIFFLGCVLACLFFLVVLKDELSKSNCSYASLPNCALLTGPVLVDFQFTISL